MIVLAILLLLLDLGALIWLASRRAVAPSLTVCLGIYFVSWLALPVPLTIAMWSRITIMRPPIARETYVMYATIEAASFLATLLVFGLMSRAFRFLERGRTATWMLPKNAETIVAILAAVTDLVARHALLGGSYDENNLLVRGILARASLILFVDSIATAFLFATMVRGARTRLLNVFLAIWILVSVAQWITTGQRVVLLMPCVLLLLWLHEHARSWKKLATGYGVIALFVATVGVVGMIVLAEMRGAKKIDLANAPQTTATIARRGPGELAWLALRHVQLKFDSISAGAALVEKQGSGVAGFRPYEGALLALVPRLIAPHKPVPGSSDGTLATTPPRAAAAALGYDPKFVNVGVSPAAVELWHFGAPGLLVLIALNALQLAFVNALFRSEGIVPRTLAMFLVGLPLMTSLYTSGDMLVMNVLRILAMDALAAIALAIMLRRRSAPAPAPAPPPARPHPSAPRESP